MSAYKKLKTRILIHSIEVTEVFKSIKQCYHPDNEILEILEIFRRMVNDCIRIGLENNISTMKKLSLLSYEQLGRYNIYANYKLCANARAAGILAARKKSIKRGFQTKNPYAVKPILIGYLGFKIVNNKIIRIPLGNRRYFDIPLNKHTQDILHSDPSIKIHSFVLTATTVSISYAKEVDEIETVTSAGVDRNLRNLTYGNCERIVQYDLAQAIDVAETTKEVIKSFKRNDVRIRRKLASKYGKRRKNRINQMLHRVSKHIVQQAKQNKETIVFEDIRHIRRLYQKGNGQGKSYRGTMNSWAFHEIKRQIEYKAKWSGVPVIQLSIKDTRGTSTLCPQCGERLQEDRRYHRQLWCPKCKRLQDRDIVAAMNLSIKGRAFLSSNGEGVFERPEGLAGEAMKRNPDKVPVILRVDASKLSRYKT